jgi:(S)-sulfolactate dehydrogenase
VTVHRVVITEFMDETSVAALAEDLSVVYDPSLADDRGRLLAAVQEADAVIVRNRTVVDEELLDAAPSVRVIGRLGVGLDNIDLDACSARDVSVKPATGANVDAVAEYVITAVLMLTRGTFEATADVVDGRWPRTESTGLEVRGRTLGLVGYGAIARRVAMMAAALGMRVIAHDPYLADDDPAWSDATRVSLEDLLEEADAVSVHVPLTASTSNLIGEAEIARLDDRAVLVNTARGGVVDEAAVVAALRAGRLRGAALDVFRTEPVSEDSGELFADVPHLFLTPHIAGITEESNVRVSDMIATEVRSMLAMAPDTPVGG